MAVEEPQTQPVILPQLDPEKDSSRPRLQAALQAAKEHLQQEQLASGKSKHSLVVFVALNQQLDRQSNAGLGSQPPITTLLPAPPTFRELSPRGPSRRRARPVPPLVIEGAESFDERHRRNIDNAQKAYAGTLIEPDSPRATHLFDDCTQEVSRNRFYVRERLGGYSAIVGGRKAKAWTLETSIWAPRKKSSDAKDFYDTEEVRRRMLLCDWQQARHQHQLEKFIVSNTLGGAERGLEEVDEVEKVLMDHLSLIYGTFLYYASVRAPQGSQA